MKTSVTIALIIVGGILVIAPIAGFVIQSAQNQSPDSPYYWFSGLVGVGLIVVGILAAREKQIPPET